MAERPEAVTIAGAGLVGSLLAIYLARRGHSVELCERRPDLRKATLSAGRSINLAISERGLAALRRVGLEAQALKLAIPMRGRMMHAKDGGLAFQAYGKDEGQHINSISRGALNALLLDAAEASGQVRLSFQSSVEALRAGILIGADGAGSSVRERLKQRLGERMQVTQELLDHGYKELTLPAGRDARHQLEPHALHIWPRGRFMLIALPNLDGSFTGTLFLPFGGPDGFNALSAPGSAHAFFTREFPDVVGLLPDLEDQLSQNPLGRLGTLTVSPWNDERTVLVGDAAHALVPFYGQGMNCGFEDCLVLDALLAEHSFERAFALFSEQRKPDADAIADMAVENFVEMRDKTADPRFLLEKAVERRLLNEFPGEFLSRYTLVSFSLAPYRFAKQVGEVAGAIVAELCQGLARAEDVDLKRADRLIRDRLAPLVAKG